MKRKTALIILSCLFLGACGDNSSAPLPPKREVKTLVPPKPFSEAITEREAKSAEPAGDSGTSDASVEKAKPKPPPPVTLEFPEADPSDVVSFDGGLQAILTSGHERVEISAELISGQSRPLEFLVVSSSGSVHEALLSIYAKASHLKSAIELIGCKEGEKKISRRGSDEMPEGDAVLISLRWQDQAGKTHFARIEDWVRNVRTDAPMERGPWIFSGGRSAFREDIQRDTFEADWTGNIIATWRDPSCVIDNPRPYAVDSGAYQVNGDAGIPDPSTEVTMIIQKAPPTPHD